MEARFTGSTQHNHDTWSFIFAPTRPLTWLAGQSVRLEIAGPYGPLEHRFSIASPPSSGEVVIATRLSGSDYKDSIAELRPGDAVHLYGIEGDFVWREHALPHIFIAAGVGITPFHAMIAERIAQNKRISAELLYSSRDEPMLFGNELEALRASHPEFRLTHQRSRTSAAQILALPLARSRLVYISGPSKMVGALYADLIAAGIAPAHILQDHFTGRLNEDG